MIECPREQDVLEAILAARWPEDLLSHAKTCPVCHDLATVAAALHAAGEEAWEEAHPPTSGQVWWRATMRTRVEGARRAARPIMALQALSAACVVGIFAAVVTRSWTAIGQWLVRIADALSAGGMQQVFIAALVIGAAVILAPFVVYFALSDD
jgi:hypothetical protein